MTHFPLQKAEGKEIGFSKTVLHASSFYMNEISEKFFGDIVHTRLEKTH